MSEEIFLVKNLKINYLCGDQRVKALENINFNLKKNEILGIVGESGSGKTTLARYLVGILDKEETEIAVDQYLMKDIKLDLFPKKLEYLRGSFISMVMQNPVTSLSPTIKIKDQFRIVLKDVLNKKSKTDQDNLMKKVLKDVELDSFDNILNKYPMELSVGMNQRINIALSIVNKPSILILDEPTSSLDEENRVKILSIISQLVKKNNLSVILITHDVLSVKKICNRILVMKEGKFVDIFYNYQKDFAHKYTNELHESALLKRNIVKPVESKNILVEFDKVSKNFNKNIVLKNFSMYLKKGETLGIIGKSGLGKTTICKLIMGMYKPSEGSVKLKKSLKIEMVFQNANLSLNHNQKIFKILNEENRINKKKDYSSKEIGTYLKDFNLSENILEKYITHLSEGQKQIISIVRGMLSRPDVIIFDEPTSSLDAVSQKKLLDLLIYVKKKYNLTYILVSHDKNVIKYMCDRCINLC